jgi:hypothetical protein
MPNPMFLKVMGITIHEYNSYSPAKKARFQTTAQKKLIDVHESDIDAYSKLTHDTAEQSADDAEGLLESEAEDKENS